MTGVGGGPDVVTGPTLASCPVTLCGGADHAVHFLSGRGDGVAGWAGMLGCCALNGTISSYLEFRILWRRWD
ncbi:MAG: hypothetical protein R2856_08430 [Caldilineaceae bacterium]